MVSVVSQSLLYKHWVPYGKWTKQWINWMDIWSYLQPACDRPASLFNIMIITPLTVMAALLGYVLGNTNNSVHKRRMCLQFEMEDHTSTATVIGRQYRCSKVECMTSCARHRSCNTFHFRSTDCTCELLETSEICMACNFTRGTTLVRLSGCNKTPPWKVITQTQRKLQWMRPRDVGSQLSILTTSSTTRQVARVLHERTYVPGFVLVADGRFLALTMNGEFVECEEALQVLTFARTDDYSWINFVPGDEIPASAVVGGHWRDGTSLYVINVRIRGAWKPGFYSTVTGRIYVKSNNNQIVASELLIENYWMKTTIRNQDPEDLFPLSWDNACIWSGYSLLSCH